MLNRAMITGNGADIGMTRLAEDCGPVLAWLQTRTGADRLECLRIEKLSGGAIQENWLLKLQITGGSHNGHQSWVLRTDAASAVAVSNSRSDEFRLLRAAFLQGVTVPEPLYFCSDNTVLGQPFFIMTAMPGQAQARKLVRSPGLAEQGPELVAQLGHIMAKLHSITPQTKFKTKGLGSEELLFFLPRHEGSAASFQIAQMRAALDNLETAHPVLEYSLNWLEDHLPIWADAASPVLCHRDFRTGNFLIEDGKCTALLDWEFAGWSDRHEDIGWLCARCWRFGNDQLPVGGLGTFSTFQKAYEDASGQSLNVTAIGYWQVMAEIRWAVIALQQAARNNSGQELSLELALSGYLVPEMEMNMLNLIDEIEQGIWADLDS